MQITTDIHDIRRWLPLDAPMRFNSPVNLTPELYETVLLQLQVERNPRYQPDEHSTFCNIYVSDGTRNLGCEIPHWYSSQEMTANMMIDYLQSSPSSWVELPTLADGQAAANNGLPTVIGWHSGSHAPGHIAFLLPTYKPVNNFDGSIASRVSQAGRHCYFAADMTLCFGGRSQLHLFACDLGRIA